MGSVMLASLKIQWSVTAAKKYQNALILWRMTWSKQRLVALLVASHYTLDLQHVVCQSGPSGLLQQGTKPDKEGNICSFGQTKRKDNIVICLH